MQADYTEFKSQMRTELALLKLKAGMIAFVASLVVSGVVTTAFALITKAMNAGG